MRRAQYQGAYFITQSWFLTYTKWLLRNYAHYTCLPRKGRNAHAVLGRYLVDPEIWHTCSMSPHPAVDGVFFPPQGIRISLDPSILFLKPGRSKISGDKKKPQYCQRGGVIEYACQISWSISKKRREQWMLNRFGMICLDQPVYTCSFFHLGPSFFGRLSAWRTLLWPLYLLLIIRKLWNHAFFGEVLA